MLTFDKGKHGLTHGRALGHAHTMGRDTVMRYGRVKAEQNFSQNTGFDTLPRSCNMVMGNPTKSTWAYNTAVSINRG